MNDPVAPLRRAFLLRTMAFSAALLLGCMGVIRLVQMGRDGLVLGIFLAAGILILTVRILSDIWEKSSVELLAKVREPMGLGIERSPVEQDLAKNIDGICGHLDRARQGLYREQEQGRRLLADVFHALGQPLTALRCSLEVGLRIPRQQEEYRQRLEDALEQAERMARLCAQFRRLADAMDRPPRPVACRIDESLSRAQEEISALAEVKGIQLCVVPPPAVMVAGDRERVSEAVFCILEFSIDGAPAGSELRVHWETTREGLVLSVESNVSGGSATEAFVRDHDFSALDANTPGSMFGLRIAEQIMTQLGGRLDRELSADRQIVCAAFPVVRMLDCREAASGVETPA